MTTPIFDFLKKYDGANITRLHMPGHKGRGFLGVEKFDLTEVDGADSLYHADGIIKESEQNASELFGVDTYFSTEGSSLAIRGMLYLCLQYAKAKGKKPFILAGRNAHKTFISAVGMLDFKVKWLYSNQRDGYLSCKITAKKIDATLQKLKVKPVAVYLTSPDYLGNVLDLESISKVCKKHDVLLLVDCAHGSYLKFLKQSQFPTDLGADMCCSSAHKTLPVLTGGGYLHVAKSITSTVDTSPKLALSLFASTSPSYLILASLDKANEHIKSHFKTSLYSVVNSVLKLKQKLKKAGYKLVGSEPLKITINTQKYGYNGVKFAEILRKNNIYCEFYDADFIVFMIGESNTIDELAQLEKALLNIEKLPCKEVKKLPIAKPKYKMSIKSAILSLSETLPIEKCEGRVLANLNVSCPPAVPIVVCGEIIDKATIEVLKYYNILECIVVK